jgi:hypothetical protein
MRMITDGRNATAANHTITMMETGRDTAETSQIILSLVEG